MPKKYYITSNSDLILHTA